MRGLFFYSPKLRRSVGELVFILQSFSAGGFLFIAVSSSAQVIDNFNDGDFTSNPHWSGDSLEWLVISGQLKSAGSLGTPGIYLSTPSSLALNTTWEFYANPKLATSSGNYMDVFLTSDSSNLKGSNSGYFV